MFVCMCVRVSYHKRALKIDIHVLKPGNVHDRVHIVGRVGAEDNGATLAAFIESIDDGWGIIRGVGAAGRDHAGGSYGLLDQAQRCQEQQAS